MTYRTLLASAAVLSFGAAMPALSQTVLTLSDGVVENSLCIGGDCGTGISFGFDTLRLKENNLRIHFEDSSSSASFPTTDWRIVANDTSNGGDSYFGVADASAGNTPFRVHAGARNHALVVDAQGDIGIGTNAPAVDIDIKTGNTPTVRLQQDTSSGFTAQTWDMAGNETNFFIRDATNGSTLPFRIRPTAPSDSIEIEANGDVSIGSGAGDAALHVRRTDGTAQLFVEESSTTTANNRILLQLTNNGSAQLSLVNSDDTSDWRFQNFADTFRATKAGTGTVEMEVDASGNMTIAGELTTSGSCSVGCDRVFDADYALPSIEDHAALMWANGYLPNVGATPEQGTLNVSDKVLRMLNELEQAHIYIDQLNAEMKTQRTEIADLKALIVVQ